jgi:hypothetical protein
VCFGRERARIEKQGQETCLNANTGGDRRVEMVAGVSQGIVRTYISSQDQVVDHGHDAAHGNNKLVIAVAGIDKVDPLSIAKETSREELVVDV